MAGSYDGVIMTEAMKFSRGLFVQNKPMSLKTLDKIQKSANFQFICGVLGSFGTMVFFPGPHALCKMDSCSYTGYEVSSKQHQGAVS